MPKLGATTVWESWEGTSAQGGIASLNHYSKGAVCAWLFRCMCGIIPQGERHFRIAPHPGGDLTFAKATYASIYGTVASGWKRAGSGWSFEIEIPANVTADIVLPDGTTKTVGTGTYEFSCKDMKESSCGR